MSRFAGYLGLTKRYGDRVAADDLPFSIKPGRVTGFLGPNGAGKTTTMRMILGAMRGGRSAYRHLHCLARSNGIPRRRVDEVIGLVGLEEVKKKRAKGFSLGMGQRLDPEGIRWIRTLMRSLAAAGSSPRPRSPTSSPTAR